MLHSNNTMFERFCGKHGGYACLHYSVPLVLSVRNSRVCRRPKFWTLVPYHRHISFAPVSTWEFSFECHVYLDIFFKIMRHSGAVVVEIDLTPAPTVTRPKTWRTCFSAKIIVRKCHAAICSCLITLLTEPCLPQKTTDVRKTSVKDRIC